jgi:hypothetical protein
LVDRRDATISHRPYNRADEHMQALDFWKAVTVDRANVLERFVSLLRSHDVAFCLIGGQAVNAYVEPVVSLDLDVVIAANRIADVERWLGAEFRLERFPHSINVSAPESDVRVRLQLDPRYEPFLGHATSANVLGLDLPVARVEDVLQGKIWAAQDSTRRGSWRQKDLADIARLIERYPSLRSVVPDDIAKKLF